MDVPQYPLRHRIDMQIHLFHNEMSQCIIRIFMNKYISTFTYVYIYIYIAKTETNKRNSRSAMQNHVICGHVVFCMASGIPFLLFLCFVRRSYVFPPSFYARLSWFFSLSLPPPSVSPLHGTTEEKGWEGASSLIRQFSVVYHRGNGLRPFEMLFLSRLCLFARQRRFVSYWRTCHPS